MAVQTTEYTKHDTEIPGLLWFDVTIVEDERGYYQETFQKQKLVEAGLSQDFDVVQFNTSYNIKRGATRGLHAEPWDKYITVIKGLVFAAYVDLRKGETFGKVVSLEIFPGKAVFLPKGVANSFQTLEDDTYYVYGVNDHWSADKYNHYTFANTADPNLNINWPIPLDDATMSERDRNHPILEDVKPMVF